MNMPKHPDTPQSFLKDEVFKTVFRRIEFHASLLKTIKEGLPEMLANQCKHCVAREDGGLVIFTESQSVASQLRFYAPTLLVKVNADLKFPFTKLLVRAMQQPEPEATGKLMKPVSQRTIATIKTSRHADSNDVLSAALARLGDTMERYAEEKS